MDKDLSCNFCVLSFKSKAAFILHRVSSPHIKKLKAEFLQHGFLVHCLACDICLSDMKQADAHIQQPQHKERLNRLLKEGQSINKEFSCESCGLLFTNRLGYEVHRTLPPHQMELSSSNLPCFFELSKHLGGLPDGSIWSLGCKVCNENYGRLDELVMHLFSKLHIHRLRQSKCVICLKDFIHTSDRETHLPSTRHKSLMRMSANKLLKQVEAIPACNKRGYMCMYCMVWCSSWPCFELHLLHDFHQAVANKTKCNQPEKATFIEANPIGGNQDIGDCEELISVNWKIWNTEPFATLSGWCHLCGTVLDFPDKAELHLENHNSQKKRHTVVHAGDFESINIPNVYHCYACAMSFRSKFSLDVHEALPQHHLRVATSSSIVKHYWCPNCGMDVGVSWTEARDGSKTTQDSQISGECTLNGGKTEVDNVQDMGEAELLRASSILVSELKSQATGPCLAEGSEYNIETRGQDACNGIREMIDKDDKDQSFNHLLLCPETLTCVKRHRISKDDSPLLLGNQSERLPGCLTDFSSNLGVPIIAAAAFARPESLQEVLHSVMTLVANSLSATIPMVQVSSARVSRKRGQEACETSEHDGRRLELGKVGLQDALEKGFKSLQSAPGLVTQTNTADGPASVVVAASILPLSPTSGSANPCAGVENPQKQESSAARNSETLHITKD